MEYSVGLFELNVWPFLLQALLLLVGADVKKINSLVCVELSQVLHFLMAEWTSAVVEDGEFSWFRHKTLSQLIELMLSESRA